MFMIFRRHTKDRAHPGRHSYQKCKCPISVEVRLKNKYIRKSLDKRSWSLAQAKLREMETGAFFPAEEKPQVMIADAVERFFTDCRARSLSGATISKYGVLLEKQLKSFAADKGDRIR
jgi:hypothetical protein